MFSRKDLERRLREDTQVFKDERVQEAFEAIDRRDFVRSDLADEAYEDYPLPIGEGQTISQPTTVAFMLELLNVEAGSHVLDVGSGSGWTTALLAHMVGESGSVLGVERVAELVSFGKENMNKYRFTQSRIVPAGSSLGARDEAPFDRILVSAAAVDERGVEILLNQLADNGILVIPINDTIVKYIKHRKEIEEERYPGFAFVPLVE